MFNTYWTRKTLIFKKPSGTSRGVLKNKPTWFIVISLKQTQQIIAIGECSPIDGLSIDDLSKIEPELTKLCSLINHFFDTKTQHLKSDSSLPFIKHDINEKLMTFSQECLKELDEFPCIQFGLESLIYDFQSSINGQIFNTPFSQGKKNIPINGLIWMGNIDFVTQQIEDKLASGFRCLKLKIGSLNFEDECKILTQLRARFDVNQLEIRVDANGAFSPKNALEKLEKLATYHIHSIEQPIAVNQWQEMAILCEKSPIPIALDEELIGIKSLIQKEELLHSIAPAYIILKPSLLGGFSQANEWIHCATRLNIEWWATSALESNIGLNAIAQWVSSLKTNLPQGLGTGQIYRNNVPSPISIIKDTLSFNPNVAWDYNNANLIDSLADHS